MIFAFFAFVFGLIQWRWRSLIVLLVFNTTFAMAGRAHVNAWRAQAGLSANNGTIIFFSSIITGAIILTIAWGLGRFAYRAWPKTR